MVHLIVSSLLLGQAPVVIDRSLAIVGGRTITLSDARTALALGLVEGQDVTPDVVRRLVDRELMLREADRYQPPEPAADRVDGRLEQVRTFAGGEARLAEILRAGGFTEGRLRIWITNDLRVAAYLQQRFVADERRQDLIADWVADLRRRTPVTMLDP